MATDPLECGQPFHLAPEGGPQPSQLVLTGDFPTTVDASEPVLAGTVEVRCRAGVVSGVVTPAAEAFLVRDDQIATLPLPQDLAGMRLELVAGEVRTLPAMTALTRCDPVAGDAEESLPAGTYDLYVRLILNRDDESSLVTVAGPWPLEVR